MKKKIEELAEDAEEEEDGVDEGNEQVDEDGNVKKRKPKRTKMCEHTLE